MSKDPFQILADELTLIRHDMDRLRRTSLDRAEAEALHGVVADALEKMHDMALQAPQGVRAAIAADRAQMSRNAANAAAEAAQGAVEGLKQHLDAERFRFAQAAERPVEKPGGGSGGSGSGWPLSAPQGPSWAPWRPSGSPGATTPASSDASRGSTASTREAASWRTPMVGASAASGSTRRSGRGADLRSWPLPSRQIHPRSGVLKVGPAALFSALLNPLGGRVIHKGVRGIYL